VPLPHARKHPEWEKKTMGKKLFGSAVTAGILIGAAVPALAPAAASAATTPASPFTRVSIADHFDLATGQMPENIALEPSGAVDLTMSAARQVVRVYPDGTQQVLATMPAPADGGVNTPAIHFPLVSGIVRAQDGTLYFLYVTGTADLTGLWRLTPGGTPERIVALPADSLPNGLALDTATGEFYSTDSVLGTVWRMSIRGGAASEWATGPDIDSLGFIGADGLKIHDGAVWITNWDQGTIVRIPIDWDGSAGTAEITASGLAGIDDFAFVGCGDEIIAAINGQNEVDLVQPDGSHTVVLTGADGLSGPSAVAVRGNEVYITSASYSLQQDPNLIVAYLGW
jgi:sugar lactone lactonase YvrE